MRITLVPISHFFWITNNRFDTAWRSGFPKGSRLMRIMWNQMSWNASFWADFPKQIKGWAHQLVGIEFLVSWCVDVFAMQVLKDLKMFEWTGSFSEAPCVFAKRAERYRGCCQYSAQTAQQPACLCCSAFSKCIYLFYFLCLRCLKKEVWEFVRASWSRQAKGTRHTQTK